MSKHLATAARSNFLLTGRNLEQNRTLGGQPSAFTGWVRNSRTFLYQTRNGHPSETGCLANSCCIFAQKTVNFKWDGGRRDEGNKDGKLFSESWRWVNFSSVVVVYWNLLNSITHRFLAVLLSFLQQHTVNGPDSSWKKSNMKKKNHEPNNQNVCLHVYWLRNPPSLKSHFKNMPTNNHGGETKFVVYVWLLWLCWM